VIRPRCPAEFADPGKDQDKSETANYDVDSVRLEADP